MMQVRQISDNEIYLLIKYIKSVLWRVAKRLSYIQDARWLKVKAFTRARNLSSLHLQSFFSNVYCNIVPTVCALIFQVVSFQQGFPPKSCIYFCSPPSPSRRRLSPFHMKNRPAVFYHKDGGGSFLWNVSKVMLDHLLTQSTRYRQTVETGNRCYRSVAVMDLKRWIFLLGSGQTWNTLIDKRILHIDLYNGADNMRRRRLCFVCISRASYAWSRSITTF